MTGRVILVVDDDPEIADLLAEMLSIDGHEVDVVTDSVEALAKAQQRTYDVIFSDINMPGLDGPAFYHRLTQSRPELRGRVVFVSGETLGQGTSTFLDGTGAPILSKPLDWEAVRRVAQGAPRGS